MKSYKLLLFFFFFLFCLFLGICFQAAYSLINPPRQLITKNPQDFGLVYKNIEFKTADNLKIKGWLIFSPKAKGTVIALHGYKKSRMEFLENRYDEFLVKGGFNVLTFDFRGHGESEGMTTLGYKEIDDVKGAVNYLENSPFLKKKNFGILGISLGAAISLMAAANIGEIKAIVADSAFNRMEDIITTTFQRNTRLSPFPFAASTIKLAELIGGVKVNKISPLNYIEKISPRPVFIIHGKFDDYIHFSNAQKLYQKAKEPKIIWATDSNHAQSFSKFKAEYERRVLGFFYRYLAEEL